MKDTAGFSLLIEQHPFLLSALATICVYQHARFQWKECISSWMEVLVEYLFCCFLTMIFDWLYLLKFKFGYHAGTIFDDLTPELKIAKTVSKWVSFVAV